MKCMYNQSKRGLPSDVRTMALKVAKEMLALQVDAVVSRAWNEMLVAMEQSGLSAKDDQQDKREADRGRAALCG